MVIRTGPDLGGLVASLPLNFLLGSDIQLSSYGWYEGGALDDGRRQFTLITSATIPVVPDIWVVAGDVRYKNGAIGVQFQIGQNIHYGYIHVDFRAERALLGLFYSYANLGYILGWAYETEPGKPILTEPIGHRVLPTHSSVRFLGSGQFDVGWTATFGATYRIQGSPHPEGPYLDVSPDILAVVERGAYTVTTPTGAAHYFWRVVRVY